MKKTGFHTGPAFVRPGLIYSYSLALLLALWAGCDTEDEPVPAYLTIEAFQLEATNMQVHGSISQKITEAKVFVVDKTTLTSHQLGTLNLPATVPVLVAGEVEINVDPVIRANGNSLYLEVYPFYERYTTSLNLAPNEDATVQPVTRYKPEAVFEFIEDFEGTGHLFQDDRDENPLTFFENSDEDVFEGNFSGRAMLDTANTFVVVGTNQKYHLDFGTVGKVFMEVNYKTDVQLEFGVLAVDAAGGESPNFEFVVLPKEKWNKIYFDMTDLVATSTQNDFFFVIRGVLPFENGQYTPETAKIYLDNIKLLHF
ncbi:MAG: hypothetical protein ACE5FF_15825 [Saprospiraceae bacterium]